MCACIRAVWYVYACGVYVHVCVVCMSARECGVCVHVHTHVCACEVCGVHECVCMYVVCWVCECVHMCVCMCMYVVFEVCVCGGLFVWVCMGVVCVYMCGGWFCSTDAAEREGASSAPCYPGCAPPLGVHTLESHILNMSCL